MTEVAGQPTDREPDQAGPPTVDFEARRLRALRHQLRTPLNHIIGYTELLLEEAEDLRGQQFVPDLQKIHAAAQQLLVVFNDMFDPSKAAADSPATPLAAFEEPGGQVWRNPLESATGESGVTATPHSGLKRTRLEQGSLLVVDDNELNRDMLSRRLELQGYRVTLAENGLEALHRLQMDPFDLVLLDIMMPEMDGFEVLKRIKADPALRHVPVIMLSALDDMESVVRCIEMGAEDYLQKPFDPVLLRARIGASLEKKRLRDQEQAYLWAIEQEQERSQRLLLNVLPARIAERLKQKEGIIADGFMEATVLFADIVGFTEWAARLPPLALVASLNEVFSTFDRLAERHGLEKIKMIGDAYMAVAGVPAPRADHVEAVADMALDMQREIAELNIAGSGPIRMRAGIHFGPVVAGVIGIKKFAYDLWGDTVNTASRMESHAPDGCIQVTTATYERLRNRYLFEERGSIAVKGKGRLMTYLLVGKRP